MSTPTKAAGMRDGDVLTIANAWASLTIQREVYRYDVASRAVTFLVRGDCNEQEFHTISEALAFVWRTLAGFETGRAD